MRRAPAIADTHPKGGDAVEHAAPFMGGGGARQRNRPEDLRITTLLSNCERLETSTLQIIETHLPIIRQGFPDWMKP